MKQYWKLILLAAVFGAVYGILKAVLKYIFGTDGINEFWDTLIVIVIMYISMTIASKQSFSPE